MAKRVRATGLPTDQARVGETLHHLRHYTGYQCTGCPLQGTCDPKPPPGGPWEIMEAEAGRSVQCRVHPTIQMVPVKVRRIKIDHSPPPAPKHERREERNVLLDANAIIEGDKGTFPGMIRLILEPPEGFHYFTTQAVADECRFLRNTDREVLFAHIEIVPSPAHIDAEIMETHGTGITPPSATDAGLFQLAKEDPRFDILVSHDRFHRWTGLHRTIGLEDRLKVYGVSEFVKYAKRHR